jgi:hypothetical protein
MANVPFTTFAFLATGANTARTQPERLAEVKCAADYGASGNGTDQTVALQACLDAAVSSGCPMFIPAGTYVVSSPGLTFNDDSDFGLWVYGAGAATILTGGTLGFTGYIFDRHLASPNNTYGPRIFERMEMSNAGAGGGCIRLGSTIGATIRNCNMASRGIAINFEDVAGSSSENVLVENVVFAHAGTGANSGAICLGGSGAIVGCDFTSTVTSLRLYGSGISVLGCRMERNDTAVLLGVDSGGTDRGLNGIEISSMPMEGNWTFLEIAGTTTGLKAGPFVMLGHDSSNAGMTPGIQGTQYGIYIHADKLSASEIYGISFQQVFEQAAVYIEDYTTEANVVFTAVIATAQNGGIPWRISSTTASFKFNLCNIGGESNSPSGTRYTFAQLPGSPLEGVIWDISDGSTGTIGNTVTSGGSANCRIRWNGTNWICIGG